VIIINNFVFKDFGFDKLVLILIFQIGLGTITQAVALFKMQLCMK